MHGKEYRSSEIGCEGCRPSCLSTRFAAPSHAIQFALYCEESAIYMFRSDYYRGELDPPLKLSHGSD